MEPTRDPAANVAGAGPEDLEAAGLDAEALKRLAFLEIDERDAVRLRALLPHFRGCEEEFAERFYAHLFRFPDASRFLQDPARVERLKRAQQHHFLSLLQAEWNAQYVAERRRVGEAHADVGIEPQWFLGAYHQYLKFCFQRFSEAQGQDWGPEQEWMLSLQKGVFFDVGLTLDAYFQESTLNLQQALDMLWRANTELRQFAQLTSHDLKTPLATVANLCEEVLDEFGTQIPQPAREMIDTARQRIFRMSTLIDELLASAVTVQETEANALVASQPIFVEAIERVRPLLDQKQIELVLPSLWPRVWGNPVRLREVFYNLLSNATKFVERKPGRIEISVREEGSEVWFGVADNGPGIPPEEIERVFVPFRRLPMHRDRPGSGLGLYFSKSIVEHLGGRLWCESELGRGSRFMVALRTGPRGEKHGG